MKKLKQYSVKGDIRHYEEGYVLKENEYLLKLRKNMPQRIWKDSAWKDGGPAIDTGFLTKFNKNGSMPVAFDGWGTSYHSPAKLPIYVFEEKPREGWKLQSWRFGQSQNWATVVHPEGFTLEIYLSQFLEILEQNTVINGVIQGEFYWKDNTLNKK